MCLADMVLINNEGVFVDKGFCIEQSLGEKGGPEHRRAATPEMFSLLRQLDSHKEILYPLLVH